jgi:hypothetical protein
MNGPGEGPTFLMCSTQSLYNSVINKSVKELFKVFKIKIAFLF